MPMDPYIAAAVATGVGGLVAFVATLARRPCAGPAALYGALSSNLLAITAFNADPADSRGRMGWPGYFEEALANNVGTIYNYYSSDVYLDNWLHSDMKDMAYFNVYPLYDELMMKGNLK